MKPGDTVTIKFPTGGTIENVLIRALNMDNKMLAIIEVDGETKNNVNISNIDLKWCTVTKQFDPEARKFAALKAQNNGVMPTNKSEMKQALKLLKK